MRKSSRGLSDASHMDDPIFWVDFDDADFPLNAIDTGTLAEPEADVHALFLHYNDLYFEGKLKAVEVKWSDRMTLCAGLCEYHGGRSGYCCIKLSEKLLQFRSRKELIETLLHEMIHAYLFVTKNNRDHDAHGPEFLKLMGSINEMGRYNISVYHNFHDEVNHFRQHWWKCNKCDRVVKRAMNRKPGTYDWWFARHQRECGGEYIKIKEPEPKPKKAAASKKRKAEKMEPKQETSPAPNSSPITNFFPKTEKESTPTKLESFDEPMFEFSDGDADDIQVLAINSASTEPKSPSDSKKRKVKDEDCVDAHTIVGNVNTTDNSEQDALLKKLDAFERDYMGTVCTVPIRFRLPSGVVVDYDFPENIPLDKVRWFIEAKHNMVGVYLALAPGRQEFPTDSLASPLAKLNLKKTLLNVIPKGVVSPPREIPPPPTPVLSPTSLATNLISPPLVVLDSDDEESLPPKPTTRPTDTMTMMAACPICSHQVVLAKINKHLDSGCQL